MKRLIFILSLLLTPLLSGVVYAQSPQDLAKKYGVTFPISELGNCTNVQTCKIYCDQPENKDVCITFAKSKGFYKETVDEKQVAILSFAKSELGCESVNSCKTFCQQKVNQEKCKAFAQKHSLATPQTPSPENEELLVKAKQNLNCDSVEECKTICDKQENYAKCAALLEDQVTSDDRAMFEKYKPQIKEFLGCDSIVTCMAFCINPLNTAKCAELGSKIGGSGQPSSQEPPEVWCPKISSECKWDGSNCFCNGPQSCSQSPGCSWNGSICNCGDTKTTISESPEIWCPKAGPGCSWDGNQCTCFESGIPTQTNIPPSSSSEPGEVWCPKIGPYCVWDGANCTCWDDCVKSGGTWTGSKCEYQGGGTTTQQDQKVDFSSECLSMAGCTWDSGSKICSCPTGEQKQLSPEEIEKQACETDKICYWDGVSCRCSQDSKVQGVSTNSSLLQQILDFILRL